MPYANNASKANKRNAHKATSKAVENSADKPALPDVYRRVTDQIIEAIEAGAGQWKMPWHTMSGAGLMRPINAASGKAYRGVNVLALWIAAQNDGYAVNEWATYKQWQEKGAQVRKGEKSHTVVFWKVIGEDGETQDGGSDSTGEDSSEGGGRRIFARGYAVFNASQVDGYTSPQEPAPPVEEQPRNREAEAFFAATGATIRNGGSRAFYRPSGDYIQMPSFAAFADPIDYYSTLGHECVHWTSDKARLNRDLSSRFGSEAYAGEELVAELGAAFLCADLHLSNTPRPDHAAYVANWLKVLKEDKHAIFTAASKAQQATDYLHGLQMQPEPEPQGMQRRAPPAP